MARVKINENKCKGCLLCLVACPKGLLQKSKKINKKGIYVVEVSKNSKDLCTGCALCAIVCPDCAIEVYKEDEK